MMNQTGAPQLSLNIVPIDFKADDDKLQVGELVPLEEEAYRALREKHWQTHAFRYDSRSGKILNVTLNPNVAPIGQQKEVKLQEHLLLMARAIQRKILVLLTGKDFDVPILRGGKSLMFWGQTEQALLLTRTLKGLNLETTEGLEVTARYDIDCRMFWGELATPYLGLVIDVGTSNVIDIPVSELLERQFSVIGKYVARRNEASEDYLHPTLELLGRISVIEGSGSDAVLKLVDNSGFDEISANEVQLEPRLEHLHDIISHVYGSRSTQILRNLWNLRQPYSTALGKFDRIQATRNRLSKLNLNLANNVQVVLGEPLKKSHKLFPEQVATDRPTLLFGAQGRNRDTVPDRGITQWGPYMYMQHERNNPVIAVICESRYRGRVEQFIEALQNGFPQELWQDERKENPFPNGLIGKFRLTRVRVEYEECADNRAETYRKATRQLLEKLPEAPDLAIVQIEEEFVKLPATVNPYFVSKATFMTAGVPTQSIRIDKIDSPAYSLAYILNSLAVACYAKLDGIPWVIATRNPTTHELVIGLGASEVSSGRLSERTRYVGLTTVFQGDGRYLVWGTTKEVEFENYATALLESLRLTVRYVRNENAWQAGDKVRLVCHVYKRLRDCEAQAIKSLVKELLAEEFAVEFAFLDISSQHPYHVFDQSQAGVNYWVNGKKRLKGKGVAGRGLCLQLDQRRSLLNLTGPGDIKTESQGTPQPLLVELHPDSDFTDMTYLLRQIYHFSYMSWRSFMPATEPVTIAYSRQIARLLGNLKLVKEWNSAALTVGNLRNRRWFL